MATCAVLKSLVLVCFALNGVFCETLLEAPGIEQKETTTGGVDVVVTTSIEEELDGSGSDDGPSTANATNEQSTALVLIDSISTVSQSMNVSSGDKISTTIVAAETTVVSTTIPAHSDDFFEQSRLSKLAIFCAIVGVLVIVIIIVCCFRKRSSSQSKFEPLNGKYRHGGNFSKQEMAYAGWTDSKSSRHSPPLSFSNPAYGSEFA